MRKVAPFVMAICLCACVAPAAHAQFTFNGPYYGATFVAFPRGVRNIGMGATGTADASNLSNGYFNPASVAFADASNLIGSYEDMFIDLSLSEFLVTTPIPFHTDSIPSEWHFAGSLGYTRFWLPTQTERTIFLPDGVGRTYDADDWMLSGGGAALWSRGVMSFAAGGTAKLIQNAPDWPAMWSFDVGVLAAFPISLGDGRVRPRLGYSALNLDSGTSFDSNEYFVRTEKRAGFGFDLEAPSVVVYEKAVPSVRFSFDYDHIDRDDDRTGLDFSSGAELAVVNMIYVRYGVVADLYDTYGLGAGWDYGHVLFRLDYAHTGVRGGTSPGFDLDRDTFGLIIGTRW